MFPFSLQILEFLLDCGRSRNRKIFMTSSNIFDLAQKISYSQKILKSPRIPSLFLPPFPFAAQKRRYIISHSFSRLVMGGEQQIQIEKMSLPNFQVNQNESVQQPMDNGWFDEVQKCNQINQSNLLHYTFEVPEEMIYLRYPTTDPLKPDLIESISTGKGLYQEENAAYQMDPVSSQIEFPSTHQEEFCRRDEPEEDFFPENGENNLQKREGAQTRNERVILQISKKVFNQRTTTEKGKRFETKNLCKHIHSETMQHLKKLHTIHQFDPKERQQVKLFCHTKASIDNFKDLFRNQKIAHLCLEFYESPEFVKEILTSKMEITSKLTILKYLKKMRKLTHDAEFKAWKKEAM